MSKPPAISRIEDAAVKKLTSEIEDKVRSGLRNALESEFQWLNKDDADLIKFTTNHVITQLESRIRERAISKVAANLGELFELMSAACDTAAEQLQP